MKLLQVDNEKLLFYLIEELQRAVTKILETGFMLSHSPLLKPSYHFALNFNGLFLHLPSPPCSSQLVSNFSWAGMTLVRQTLLRYFQGSPQLFTS
jgi:hypothetical protein